MPLRPAPRPPAQIGQGAAVPARQATPEPGLVIGGGARVYRPGPVAPLRPGVPATPRVDARTQELSRDDLAALDGLAEESRVDARAARPAGTSQPGQGARENAGSSKVDARTDVPEEKPEAFPSPRVVAPMIRSPMGAQLAKAAMPPVPSKERLDLIVDARKQALGARADDRGGTPLEPTRSPKTEAAYRHRGDLLVRRFRRERNLGRDVEQFSPMDFAIWCLSLRHSGLKPASWRLYRQAAITILQPVPDSEGAIELLVKDAPGEVSLGTTETVSDPNSERRTSANKEKRFAREDFARIEAALQLKRRSNNADVLRDWLKAGIATGLRPVEWKATDVVEVPDPRKYGAKRRYLLVLNAKITNGRGNGVVRTLDITNFSEDTLGSVRRMSATGAMAYARGDFGALQSHCSRILYEIASKFWRRKLCYSLYSCRHQFIANMKALGLSNEEISAMAGHVVDETAAQTYGKKRSGWSPDKILDRPRGIPEEIATVRKRLVLHEERQDLIHMVEKGRPRVPAPVDDGDGPGDGGMEGLR